MIGIARLSRDRRGSSAAEFALVLPLLLILLFVIIDGGRYLWSVNRLEKAAQWGARYAVVTNPIEGGLTSANYNGSVVGGVTIGQGDVIPAAALGTITCTSTSCTCTTTPCPTAGTYNSAGFTNLATRMRLIAPDIADTNIKILYRGSGLGYAGDPSASGQISPLVTVQVSGLAWQPLSGFTLKSAGYPTIETTLSAEDSIGNSSY